MTIHTDATLATLGCQVWHGAERNFERKLGFWLNRGKRGAPPHFLIIEQDERQLFPPDLLAAITRNANQVPVHSITIPRGKGTIIFEGRVCTALEFAREVAAPWFDSRPGGKARIHDKRTAHGEFAYLMERVVEVHDDGEEYYVLGAMPLWNIDRFAIDLPGQPDILGEDKGDWRGVEQDKWERTGKPAYEALIHITEWEGAVTGEREPDPQQGFAL